MKALWLTLPGAAMCSYPIGTILVLPYLSQLGLSVPAASQGVLGLLAILLIPTTGHPGLRMILMVFNFIARGLADIICIFFVLAFVTFTIGMIWNAFSRYP